ncbi:endonuclease/exonuclease/phosphatase family protein [Gephyromycinifex aptenodytis]|uniref:endonuclease/exonuclease/phosphatase family protein n=1 Tax=Gephyromycinifex aptenodytis TaxID=2716227 RepID=UPI001446F711|nr:endonuclease/exonuclease/phosphatase family protein [Gephyromycinifex aptenodytis]
MQRLPNRVGGVSPAQPRWRRCTLLCLRILVAVGVLLAPLAYLDLDGPVPLIQALLPPVALVGLAVAAALLLLKDVLASLVAAVVCVLLLAPVLPLAARPTSPAPRSTAGIAAGTTADLRVASLNMEFGQADPLAVLDQVRLLHVDVLVLLEVTPSAWARLQSDGLRELLPYATGTTSTSASGTVVAAAAPLNCPRRSPCPAVRQVATPTAIYSDPDPFTQVDVHLADGTPLRAAHPFPPSLVLGMAPWRAGLARLQNWLQRQEAAPRLIVAGDFNAGQVHPAFRRITAGLTPAPRAGWPWTRTWPLESAVPPFVQIDHVLSRGFSIEAEGIFTVPGTDHAGVWAQLRPTSQ